MVLEVKTDDDLLNILADEERLLAAYVEKLKRLNQSVCRRKWADIETVIPELSNLSQRIDNKDTEREQLLTALYSQENGPAKKSLLEILPAYPEDKKNAFLSHYENIQSLLFRIKTITDTIDHYLKTVSFSISQILEGVFPHRKGKIYSSNGRMTNINDDTVMIDKKY